MVNYILKLDQLPPSVNNAYFFIRKGRRTIKIKTGKLQEYIRDYVHPEILKQIKNPTILKKEVLVEIKITFSNQMRHDIDNYQKIILDCFKGKLWEDDDQIVVLKTSKFYKKDEPSIEISITEQKENIFPKHN